MSNSNKPKLKQGHRPAWRFSLGMCVWLCGGQSVLAAETIEILYETGSDKSTGIEWVLVVLIVVSVAAAFALFSVFKIRKKLLEKDELLLRADDRLKEAQRIARMGSWSRDFETGETFWSDEAKLVLGLSVDDESRHYESLIHPDDIEKVTEIVAGAYFQGGNYQCDHRIICPNGQEKYIRLAGQVFLEGGSSPVRETGTIQDVTDRKLSEIALQRSEKRMRSILDAAPYPIIILEKTIDFSVLYANQSAYTLFGLSLDKSYDELQTQELWVNQHEREEYFSRLIRETSLMDFEAVMRGKDGQTFWASLSANCMDFSGIDSLYISILDVTERKNVQQELERMATTDSLTGLLNRRSFFNLANKELKRSLRARRTFVLLMMDLDHFKQINDNYGHGFGDEVIKRFAELSGNCLREEDLLGRVGGEEFCAILVDAEEEGGYLVAERIRKRWQQETFQLDADNVSFTISIGVSKLMSEYERIEDIMERADVSLYSAKQMGRDRVVVYSEDIKTKTHR